MEELKIIAAILTAGTQDDEALPGSRSPAAVVRRYFEVIAALTAEGVGRKERDDRDRAAKWVELKEGPSRL